VRQWLFAKVQKWDHGYYLWIWMNTINTIHTIIWLYPSLGPSVLLTLWEPDSLLKLPHQGNLKNLINSSPLHLINGLPLTKLLTIHFHVKETLIIWTDQVHVLLKQCIPRQGNIKYREEVSSAKGCAWNHLLSHWSKMSEPTFNSQRKVEGKNCTDWLIRM
jgi:hypothetical protein